MAALIFMTKIAWDRSEYYPLPRLCCEVSSTAAILIGISGGWMAGAAVSTSAAIVIQFREGGVVVVSSLMTLSSELKASGLCVISSPAIKA